MAILAAGDSPNKPKWRFGANGVPRTQAEHTYDEFKPVPLSPKIRRTSDENGDRE